MSGYRKLQHACCQNNCTEGSCPETWKVNGVVYDWGVSFNAMLQRKWKLVYRVGPITDLIRCQWWTADQSPDLAFELGREAFQPEQLTWRADLRLDIPSLSAWAVWQLPVGDSYGFGPCDATYSLPLDSSDDGGSGIVFPDPIGYSPWRTDDSAA